MRPAVHFVGFRDDRYWSAVRVWGLPDFYHPDWDTRAAREIHPEDTVVFARGEHDQAPHPLRNSSDTVECARLEKLSVEAWDARLEQGFVACDSR